MRLADGAQLDSDRVMLAPGNSARELYERFAADGRVFVEAKPFAIGFRAEHPQALINAIQYGAARRRTPSCRPPTTSWPRTSSVDGEMRGVYSLLHVPGRHRGADAHRARAAVHQRHVQLAAATRSYANAGIVVSVSVEDFAREGFHGPLAGLEFQRHWEKKAYELGGGQLLRPGAVASPTTWRAS